MTAIWSFIAIAGIGAYWYQNPLSHRPLTEDEYVNARQMGVRRDHLIRLGLIEKDRPLSHQPLTEDEYVNARQMGVRRDQLIRLGLIEKDRL